MKWFKKFIHETFFEYTYWGRRKLKQKLCKHMWSPITLEIIHPPNRDGKQIRAFATCQECGIARIRQHFVTRKSMLRRCNTEKDLERLSWAVAGALAYELHKEKLTNYHLGWID